MGLKLTNNAVSRLASGISAGDLSLSVTPGDGALFPTLGAGDYFPATLVRASDSAVEIVKVTARATDVFTIERAQEGTTALAFVANDRIELRLTAGTVEALPAGLINAAASKTTPVDADQLGLVDSAAGNVLKKLTWANLKATLKSYFDTLYRLPADDVTIAAGKAVVFEGSTDDAFETTLTVVDPTADRALSLPNKSGTLAVNADVMLLDGSQAMTGPLNEAEGAAIASAATVNLDTATGNFVHITGTTAITGLTLAQGAERVVVFDGVLTLTNGASLILPTGANITTAAGDCAVFRGEGSGVVRCVGYMRANGQALAGSGGITLGTAVATTSGTAIDFTGIPSTAKRVTVMFNAVSTNGGGQLVVQIGSGSVDTSGYAGGVVTIISTSAYLSESLPGSGFRFEASTGSINSSGSRSGHLVLTHMGSNIWIASGTLGNSGNAVVSSVGGTKTLSGALDRLRLTNTNGDTFDAGSVNILYET